MAELPDRLRVRAERNRLSELEEQGRKYLDGLAAVLKAINEEKLYQLDYKNFDEYCKSVWGFGKTTAYALISDERIKDKVSSTMSEIPDIDLPSKEEIMSTDLLNDSPETSEEYSLSSNGATEVVEPTKTSDPAEPEKPKESLIPARLMPVFSHCNLIRDAAAKATTLTRLLRQIEDTKPYKDFWEGKKRLVGFTHVQMIARHLTFMLPSRPCPECGGAYEPSQDSDPCPVCKDRGYQTAEEVEGLI